MWEINTREQLVTIALSVACGCILCVIYDFLRSLRKAGARTPAAVFTGDVLFFAVAAVIVFFLYLARTGGEIRGYVLFFIVCGFILCRLTVSKMLFPAFAFVIKQCAAALSFLSLAAAKAADLLQTGAARAAKGASVFLCYCKKLLKNAFYLLYNKGKSDKAGENADGVR